ALGLGQTVDRRVLAAGWAPGARSGAAAARVCRSRTRKLPLGLCYTPHAARSPTAALCGLRVDSSGSTGGSWHSTGRRQRRLGPDAARESWRYRPGGCRLQRGQGPGTGAQTARGGSVGL
ncbi:unnamed protein product, partial [Polarella glacialis]